MTQEITSRPTGKPKPHKVNRHPASRADLWKLVRDLIAIHTRVVLNPTVRRHFAGGGLSSFYRETQATHKTAENV